MLISGQFGGGFPCEDKEHVAAISAASNRVPDCPEILLESPNLRKTYRRGGTVFSRETEGARFTAVNDVSFCQMRRDFSVVGESGCGKTTLARMLLRLIEPDGGELRFDARDLFALRGEELRSQRRQMQMIVQDPFASLNPRMRVAEIVAEPLAIHVLGLSEAQHGAHRGDPWPRRPERSCRSPLPPRILRRPAPASPAL